jgi:hypothetical protein
MAVPDKARPDTAVRVEKGDTLSAIAKEAGITLKELYVLNPKFKSDPKYNGGNLIFSNTLVNLAPPVKAAVTPKVETPVVPKVETPVVPEVVPVEEELPEAEADDLPELQE